MFFESLVLPEKVDFMFVSLACGTIARLVLSRRGKASARPAEFSPHFFAGRDRAVGAFEKVGAIIEAGDPMMIVARYNRDSPGLDFFRLPLLDSPVGGRDSLLEPRGTEGKPSFLARLTGSSVGGGYLHIQSAGPGVFLAVSIAGRAELLRGGVAEVSIAIPGEGAFSSVETRAWGASWGDSKGWVTAVCVSNEVSGLSFLVVAETCPGSIGRIRHFSFRGQKVTSFVVEEEGVRVALGGRRNRVVWLPASNSASSLDSAYLLDDEVARLCGDVQAAVEPRRGPMNSKLLLDAAFAPNVFTDSELRAGLRAIDADADVPRPRLLLKAEARCAGLAAQEDAAVAAALSQLFDAAAMEFGRGNKVLSLFPAASSPGLYFTLRANGKLAILAPAAPKTAFLQRVLLAVDAENAARSRPAPLAALLAPPLALIDLFTAALAGTRRGRSWLNLPLELSAAFLARPQRAEFGKAIEELVEDLALEMDPHSHLQILALYIEHRNVVKGFLDQVLADLADSSRHEQTPRLLAADAPRGGVAARALGVSLLKTLEADLTFAFLLLLIDRLSRKLAADELVASEIAFVLPRRAKLDALVQSVNARLFALRLAAAPLPEGPASVAEDLLAGLDPASTTGGIGGPAALLRRGRIESTRAVDGLAASLCGGGGESGLEFLPQLCDYMIRRGLLAPLLLLQRLVPRGTLSVEFLLGLACLENRDALGFSRAMMAAMLSIFSGGSVDRRNVEFFLRGPWARRLDTSYRPQVSLVEFLDLLEPYLRAAPHRGCLLQLLDIAAAFPQTSDELKEKIFKLAVETADDKEDFLLLGARISGMGSFKQRAAELLVSRILSVGSFSIIRTEFLPFFSDWLVSELCNQLEKNMRSLSSSMDKGLNIESFASEIAKGFEFVFSGPSGSFDSLPLDSAIDIISSALNKIIKVETGQSPFNNDHLLDMVERILASSIGFAESVRHKKLELSLKSPSNFKEIMLLFEFAREGDSELVLDKRGLEKLMIIIHLLKQRLEISRSLPNFSPEQLLLYFTEASQYSEATILCRFVPKLWELYIFDLTRLISQLTKVTIKNQNNFSNFEYHLRLKEAAIILNSITSGDSSQDKQNLKHATNAILFCEDKHQISFTNDNVINILNVMSENDPTFFMTALIKYGKAKKLPLYFKNTIKKNFKSDDSPNKKGTFFNVILAPYIAIELNKPENQKIKEEIEALINGANKQV